MGSVPTTGVAITAIGVAVIRARESERADRLYDDPLAAAFVAAARAGFPAERWARLTALAGEFAAWRTVGVRLVDDRIRAGLAAGLRQIVLLGAGLDTRAYRMGLPGDAVIFEIDLPETFAFKEPVLGDAVPSCRREVVAADLRADWDAALLERGFRPELPTHWIDEGSLGYLTEEWNQGVVRTLTALSAPGSWFATARVTADQGALRYRELRDLVGAPGRAPDTAFDAERWLRDLGWDTEFRGWNAAAAPFGRAVAVPDPQVGTVHAVRC
ncbi:SAM-dependent methyltransferase [Nocardia jiangsuensis]|uniref:S-adenosyl-L-methionine-dependent methyltransferase n=1 Tax=Nocardia jiangsuensis TaxID=1691563 RepID=A0ABV8DM80_9NOCA